MFELSFTEMAVILLVALIVIGPKQLPVVVRTVSKWVKEAKGIAQQLYAEFHNMADDSGVNEAKKSIFRETKYILDQEGKYQEVYDISDFQFDKKPVVTTPEDKSGA